MTEETEASSPASEPELTLAEFCIDVSRADKRVELIAGFHAEQRAAGRVKATAAEWSALFGAFERAPST